jgi:hypothetical protein
MKKEEEKRTRLRPKFWEQYVINELNESEWEALCDGCGKCCLHKLEDEESRAIEYTKISCRLLDCKTCKCGQYLIRKQFVPDCVVLSPRNIDKVAYWMPETCAYRLLYEKKPLYSWHHLISGSTETVHEAGISIRNICIPEFEIPEEEWEDHLFDETRG